MPQDFEQLIKEGRLDECRTALMDAVKKDPSDSSLRIFLFQLFSVLGEWERARTQLEVAAGMDPKSLLLKAMYEPALTCEAYRSEVAQGLRAPVVFGEPEEWMGWLVQANQMMGDGNVEAALALREKAFEAAPATSGSVDGKPFEWIADADSHFGPMLEAVINGTPYWVPFQRIRQIQIEPVTDLRDMIWIPAQFVWTNGGETFGLIPVRYSGSETHEDAAVRLSRKTDWVEAKDGVFRGLGQRVLTTDDTEFAILEARAILLDNEEVEAEGGETEAEGT